MSFSTLVLEMDEHGLADAFRDPMMMGLGAMVIAAGAYMAIVMQVWTEVFYDQWSVQLQEIVGNLN